MPFQNDPFLQSFFVNPASFSVEEMEWLCKPNYTAKLNDTAQKKAIAEKAREIKKHIAKILANLFQTDNDLATKDRWKAYHYQSQYEVIPPKPPRQQKWWRLDTLYRWHAAWYTGIRLFLVRLGRITAAFGRAFLPAFFGFFGLSYGFTFLVDLAVVLKVTFSLTSIKASLRQGHGFFKPTWIRFKNILTKDNRPYRMMNDFVWFAVNCATLCVTGPLFFLISPFLNLTCFIFDTGHESFWLGWERKKYNQLIEKLENNIHAHEKQQSLSPPSEQHQKEIQTLVLLRDQVKVNRNAMIRRRLWISIWTALLLVGMIMVYFPPTTLPAVFLVGAFLALFAGSVFTGLGRRLYLTAEERIQSPPKKCTTNAQTNQKLRQNKLLSNNMTQMYLAQSTKPNPIKRTFFVKNKSQKNPDGYLLITPPSPA